MKKLIIASTSTIHGGSYLDYLLPELKELFKNCSTILFIPFAQPSGISHDEYTMKVSQTFEKINKKVIGIHTFENKNEAIQQAEGIFTGGGNTFLLVSKLYELKMEHLILEQVLEAI
jgi:dipeptidase E